MRTRSVQQLVNGNIEVTIPIYIRREGHRVVMDNKSDKKENSEEEDISPLRRRLIMGFQLLDKWEKNPMMSSTALAEEESMDRSLLCKILSLVNLAPDIVEGIMSDPPTFDISVKKVFSHRLPDDWNEQRKFLGLPEKDYAG
jgi:hypothetical protein